VTTRSFVEQQLCRLHHRRYCHLVGNGTAGIALSLEALGVKSKHVAVPDSVCLNVPLSVIFSGNQPVYLDIDRSHYALSFDELEKSLPSLGAIVAVHGYGHISPVDRIEVLGQKAGIAVIEDACLVQGGELDGRQAGSFGSVSVDSFGAGKPITVGDGGAVLTDNFALYQGVKRLDSKLPSATEGSKTAIEALGREHTRLYNEHFGRDLQANAENFRKKAFLSKAFFHHRFDESLLPELCSAVDALPGLVALRWSNWRKLSDALHSALGDAVRIMIPAPGSVPWRLNLFVNHRDEVMRALHEKKIHASSWHPCASSFLEAERSVCRHEVSEDIARNLLNLWITGEDFEHYLDVVPETVQKIILSLEEH